MKSILIVRNSLLPFFKFFIINSSPSRERWRKGVGKLVNSYSRIGFRSVGMRSPKRHVSDLGELLRFPFDRPPTVMRHKK